jgi:hypothetical protein
MIKLLANTGCRSRNVSVAFGADAALFEAINLLDPHDRFVIEQFYFDRRPDSEELVQLGISQPALSKSRAKALSNLAAKVGPLLRHRARSVGPRCGRNP